jgi:hypothetical protein
MDNSKNPCRSKPRKMRPTSQMSKLALNFFHGDSGMGKGFCTLAQNLMQLLEGFALLQSLPFIPFHHLDLLRKSHRAGTRTHLLPSVMPILHQRFRNQLKPAARGQQKHNPGIVELFRRDRAHGVEQISPKGKGCSGDDGVVAQNLESPATGEFFLIVFMQSQTRPQMRTHRPRFLIDHVGVAESGNDIVGLLKCLLEPSQFTRIPDVILICKGNGRAATQRDALFEVSGGSEIYPIDFDANREQNSSRKLAENLDRAVRGSVVAYDEFFGEPILRGDAFELGGEKFFAVECAHRNGDRDRGHLLARAITHSKIEIVANLSVPGEECL